MSEVSLLSQHLRGLGWLADESQLLAAEKAGEGNMNCVVRIHTTRGSAILKQSRPWVEKYPHIPAPADRVRVEGAFYREAGGFAELADRMPRLLGFDPRSRLLMLEDLAPATDFTFIYARRSAPPGTLESLTGFLAVLHRTFRGEPRRTVFENREMRRLNHEHIFSLPLRPDNGLSYAGAGRLQKDERFVDRVRQLGSLYLSDGGTLVHGDFFPGSWMSTTDGAKVIDPEFCFYGPPEFDLGVMRAHMILAGIDYEPLAVYGEPVDESLARRFAGVEIMRRLIGVAQLPLEVSGEERMALLDRAREMVLS